MKPKAAIMLALGFSSGLPFLLTGNTLGYWLRDEGTTLTAIGLLSWVQLTYSWKFLWAPFIDKADAPIFGALGRRRGWMLLAQCLIGLGLFAMAMTGPQISHAALAGFALLVAFSSATQDIVIDAWRIEAASDNDELSLLSSAYQLGYRGASLMTDALILISANHLGWPISYVGMAILMTVGMLATLKAGEPLRAAQAVAPLTMKLWRRLFDAILGPLFAFFRTHGVLALLMLAMISLYRLPDFVMGPMANPLYHDIGLSKDVVGGVRASVGLWTSLLGIAAGGISAARFGYMKTLIAGAILQSLAIACYALLPYSGGDLVTFASVMAADNFATSFAGVALVTYMSSLTSIGYTATQYALLSSVYAILGKFIKGFSGTVVDGLAQTHAQMDAYAIFFIGCAAIGLPALILVLALTRLEHGSKPTPRAAV